MIRQWFLRVTLFTASYILFYFLHALSGVKTTEKSMKTPIDRPLCQFCLSRVSRLSSWRHGSTYCDLILTDRSQNVSKFITRVFPPSSSWLLLVNNRVRFHGLACKKFYCYMWQLVSCAKLLANHPTRAKTSSFTASHILFYISYTLGREYREVRNRYSQLLFTSEDRLCANLRLQEQSTNRT